MRTTLRIDNEVARITIDDGKVNAMSTQMLEEISARLQEASQEARVTVVRGRPGIFSAGFDMPTLSEGLEPSVEMMSAGMRTIMQMLAHPHPIVAACTGHAFPMGAFLMLCSDVRFAVNGEFKIGMNEVAIGLTVPRFALALAEHRLSRSGFAQVTTGRLFTPSEAVAAGYIDHLVTEAELDRAVDAAADQLLLLDAKSYVGTKARINGAILETIAELSERETLTAELLELSG
jgi:enoyl-CoA hydratase